MLRTSKPLNSLGFQSGADSWLVLGFFPGFLCAEGSECSSFSCGGAVEERSFVEGQPNPAVESGYRWELVQIPATYKTVVRQVEVSPASTYEEKVPAKYETRDSTTVQVASETKRLVKVPAQYKSVVEQTVDKPAQMVWRKFKVENEAREETHEEAKHAIAHPWFPESASPGWHEYNEWKESEERSGE
jgi:hypothetical protein